MSVSNIKFLRELNSLKKLINYYLAEQKLTAFQPVNGFPIGYEVVENLATQLKDFNIIKRAFNYNSLIISLYGFFEKFIEDTIETYVNDLNIDIVDYDKLPESVVKHHLPLSIQMINKVESVKYQGQLTKENIINNLHSCINDKNNYILNKEAFKQHSSNFRYQIITEVFNKIGVNDIGNLIINNKKFRNYILDKLGKSESEKLDQEEAYYHIDDLAERRNDVAHGVSGQILNPELLNDYVDFFENYSFIMTELVNENLLTFKLLNTAINLGDLTGWFKNGQVICFNTYNNVIKVGDSIWGLNEHGYIKCKVLSIRLNDFDVREVDNEQNYDIGVELDIPLKKTHKIYILSQPKTLRSTTNRRFSIKKLYGHHHSNSSMKLSYKSRYRKNKLNNKKNQTNNKKAKPFSSQYKKLKKIKRNIKR